VTASFELGVNYWPRRHAMYMWRELDLGAIRDELAQIADIGFDVVRLFTLMRDFVPSPVRVDAAMIEHLVSVVGAAKDAGLRVVPTVVVLNMSGRIWWPDWMPDAGGRTPCLYTDPTMLRTQALLAESIARALAGDEVVRAIDLTNEIDDAQRPPSRDAGWVWASLLAGSVRRWSPGIPIQIGAHLPSLSAPDALRIDDLAAVADEDVMHAYPLYSDVARSHLDPELVPFACALTADLARTGRAPLMQEFGLCTAPRGAPGTTIVDDFLGTPSTQYLASEEEGATYYERVLRRLACIGAAGAYAWCYGDYDSRLFDRPPLDTVIRERTFGLVRADASEKAACDVFRAFRRQRDSGLLAMGPVPTILDVSTDEYYRAPREHFARLYTRWAERFDAE
jgi:endo-1,4-beta-mannosidase